MIWDETEPTYHYATLTDETTVEAAMAEWWRRLILHAEQAEDWNTVVADAWVETGRIIGHVQNDDQAVGMDRGFRLCLTQRSITEELHAADYNIDVYDTCSRALGRAISRSAKTATVQAWLEQKKAKVWICENGELMAIIG